jgi:hypothetical protein
VLIPENHLLNSFNDDYFPPFPCPSCGATLILVSDSLKIFESSESWHLHDVGAIGDDEGGGVFSAMLHCANKPCGEHVAMAGYANPGFDRDSSGDDYVTWYLRPEYFTPTIPIFRIPASVPVEVKNAVLSSFRLFWVDSAAAGNALRTALELLLDAKGVPRLTNPTPPSTPQRRDLHDRIQSFRTQEPEIGDLLLATKWIGNAASHSTSLEPKTVIRGYELLSLVLEELFDKRTSRIKDFAQRVNQNRGPVN